MTTSKLQVPDAAIGFIRSHAGMFVGESPPMADLLMSRLVTDVTCVSHKNVTSRHTDGWWIVTCEEDWIQSDPRSPSRDFFTHIVPFPEAGQNAFHGRVLLTAFASDVVTGPRSGLRNVKGEGAKDQRLAEIISTLPAWERIVAFRMVVE